MNTTQKSTTSKELQIETRITVGALRLPTLHER